MGASATLLKEWILEDKMTFKNHLRMNESQFEDLLSKISPLISKQDTTVRKCLPAKLKLEITLKFLATGDCFGTLEAAFRVPRCTICKFLPEVLSAIYNVLENWIKVPASAEEWSEKMKEYYDVWNFPNCCGAMDGKHVSIRCPQKSGSYYFNCKKTFSIIVFAIVDANYNFIYIDVGTNGRSNDALVFSKTTFNSALQNNLLRIPPNGIFVGDDAFPLRHNILKPYSKNNLTQKEKVFNYRLSRARRVSENAFGVLVSRFRVYEKPISLRVKTAELLVKATCVLHNWLRQSSSNKFPYISEGLIDVELWEEGRVSQGSWREIKHTGLNDAHINASNNYTRIASAVRDSYATRFCTTDSVPWQWKMI